MAMVNVVKKADRTVCLAYGVSPRWCMVLVGIFFSVWNCHVFKNLLDFFSSSSRV